MKTIAVPWFATPRFLQPRFPRTSSPRIITAVLATATIGYLAIVCYAMNALSYDEWSAFIILPVLVAATVAIVGRAARREAPRWFVPLVLGGFALKMVGAGVRYVVAFDVYDGGADAGAYHQAGTELAALFRVGIFSADLPAGSFGTHFIQVVTGLVYTVTGPTKIGGFLVFSWLGFWGLYLLYRAFQIAFPERRDDWRYGVLVLTLPSLAFWPSSVGKEAWMTLGLGLSANGAARLLGRGGGIWLVALGTLVTAMVRPHIAILVIVALLAAQLLRFSGASDTRKRSARTFVVLAVLLLMGALVLRGVEQKFGLEAVDRTSLGALLDTAEERTTQGGSRFDAPRVRSFVEFPTAALSVLFRPFPHEAINGQSLIASLESLVLLLLIAMSWRRLLAIPRQALYNPYVVFSLVYVALFVVAFSAVGNFGILTRQRVQVLPFLLVFLAMPSDRPTSGRPTAELASRSFAPPRLSYRPFVGPAPRAHRE